MDRYGIHAWQFSTKTILFYGRHSVNNLKNIICHHLAKISNALAEKDIILMAAYFPPKPLYVYNVNGTLTDVHMSCALMHPYKCHGCRLWNCVLKTHKFLLFGRLEDSFQLHF